MKSSRKDRALWLGQHVLPHEAKMRAWLERKLLGELEVDDIIQETFAILSELESVEDIRDPRSYAFQTAFSIIQRHLRRSRIVSFQTFTALEQVNEQVNIASDAPSPESEAADRGDLRSVEDYIAKLPPKYRDVIILRRIDGLSYREIAERLSISENAVEKLLSRGAHLLMTAFGRGQKAHHASAKDERKTTTVIEKIH